MIDQQSPHTSNKCLLLVDIDECKTVSSSCVEDQLCINTVGSFVCYNKDAPSGTGEGSLEIDHLS